MFPAVVDVPSRGAGALDAVETTEPDFLGAIFGLGAGVVDGVALA